MRVLLVNPSVPKRFLHPPLGLLYYATICRDRGDEVAIVDGAIVGDAGILAEAKRFSPDKIGIQILSIPRHAALRIAALLKASNPRVKILLGGAHATVMPEQLKTYPFVDEVYVGNLDTAGILPAWDMVGRVREAAISSSTGCPGRCSFCYTPKLWKKWVGRSPEDVVLEMNYLYDRVGVKEFFFTDDCFTYDRDRTIAICEEIIRHGRKFKWFCSTRADAVDEEMLFMMGKAGCWRVAFGVESTSPMVLKGIHKNVISHVEAVEKSIEAAHAIGISTMAAMMVGNPEESDETVSESSDFLKRTMPTIITQARGVWLLPGTALYRKAVKEGIITDEFWYGEVPVMYWPFSQKQLRKWALVLTEFRPWRYFVKRLADRLYIYFPRLHEKLSS